MWIGPMMFFCGPKDLGVTNMKYQIVLPLVLLSALAMVPDVRAQKLTAQDIIAKHLDSIAAADKRSMVKSIVGF